LELKVCKFLKAKGGSGQKNQSTAVEEKKRPAPSPSKARRGPRGSYCYSSVPVPPPVPPPPPPPQLVPGLLSVALPMLAELKVTGVVEPGKVAIKVALEQLPELLVESVIVKVPVKVAALLPEVAAMSCTASTSFPAALLVTLVVFQVPLETTVVLVPPLERVPDLKRVKLPLPGLVASPPPSSNK
jgi:hypothetical protein